MLSSCGCVVSRLLKRSLCRPVTSSICNISGRDDDENDSSSHCTDEDDTGDICAADRHVTVVEVGPRDGLQNEPRPIDTPLKVALIDRLSACGLSCIEAASFVSPRWVPQMADAAGVMAAIRRVDGVRYPVLVPNLHGLRAALDAGARDVAVFTAASDTFCRRNTNCSLDASLRSVEAVVRAARDAAVTVRVRGYVSCVCGCPYEGAVSAEEVARVAARLFKMGCHEVALGDTTGQGTPGHVRRVLRHVLAARVPVRALAIHCHDTYGQALANIATALQMGVRVVDASVGGLGGCPYAPGASGNVSTEDVVYMLHGMRMSTGVDLARLVETGAFICGRLGRPNMSRVAAAMTAGRTACETEV